jgi:hypothetical protein
MGATYLLLLLIRPAKLVNRAAARFILRPAHRRRDGSAGSKGYDPPFNPANFPSPRIFVFA